MGESNFLKRSQLFSIFAASMSDTFDFALFTNTHTYVCI